MWNADLYNKFGKERIQPSKDLAARIEIENCRRVLDVGCGSGMSTLCVKQHFPNAEIIGVDLSQEMLLKAKELLPDVQFFQRDCSVEDALDDLGKFDVVFSNAFLQWLEFDNGQEKFVHDAKNLLNAGGILAMQIPLFSEMQMSKIIENVAAEFDKENLFAGIRAVKNHTSKEYYEIFSKNFSKVEAWQTNYFHQMQNSDAIVDFVKSTALNPFLERLTEKQSAEFLNALRLETGKHYTVCENGKVLFPFHRMFFVTRV